MRMMVGGALVLAAVLALVRVGHAEAEEGVFGAEKIAGIMRKVADAGLTNNHGHNLDVNKDNDWATGAFRTGITAIYRVTGDEKYYKSNVAWGEACGWKLKSPVDNADDECAGQTFCETYLLKPGAENEKMYAATKTAFDGIVLKPGFRGRGLWNWEDSLFMSPPVVAMLGKITADKAYFDALVSGWNDAAGELYDAEKHLWHFRGGAAFKTTPKGNPKFWGPGNAWVLAGVRRCLNYVPEDYGRRGELMAYFKDMSAAIAAKQQADGFWRTSLWEPTEYPDAEASCMAFFTYAMGMGILKGDLDEKTYLPVVKKGWSAVVSAVDEKGKLGRCQAWSNTPGGVGVGHNTPEGTGAFLLAGEAMWRLATREGAATGPATRAASGVDQGRSTDRILMLASVGEAAVAEVQEGKGHEFACTDYTGGKVFIVGANGKVEWEYPAATCNDVWALANGNLLFNDGKSVKEVSREKKLVWSYEGKSNIYGCQRLADGNTFVAECESGRLLEVDPAGKVVKEVRLLAEGKSGGGAYMRNARRLENGHYLVAHYGGQVVKEYDGDGKVVWEVAAEGGPHSVVRLANGNTLIACADMGGHGGRVVEVDAGGKTVWEVKGDDLPGVSLKFMTGLERLANGNTVMTNWQGHGKLGQTADIVEVTRDKQVVWKFADHVKMKTVSSVMVMDAEGWH